MAGAVLVVVGYVALVAAFSVTAGLLYGAWVDGVNSMWLLLGLAAFAATLTVVLAWLRQRQQRVIQAL